MCKANAFVFRSGMLLVMLMLVLAPAPAATGEPQEAGAAEAEQAVAPPRPLAELRRAMEQAYAERSEVTDLTLEVARHETVEAAKTLITLATADWRLGSDAAAAALATMQSPEVLAYLASLYDQASAEEDWPTRVVVVRALSRASTGAVGQAVLEKAAEDQTPAVRIAAVQAAEQSGREPATVQAVATRARDTAQALGDPGRSYQLAHQVLMAAQAAPPDAEDGDNDNQAQPPRRRRPAPPVLQGNTPVFFDTPVVSRNLLIIVDTSGSMQTFDIIDPLAYDDLPTTPVVYPQWVANGRARAPSDQAWVRWLEQHPETIRIERVRRELRALLHALPDETMINIIEFNSHATAAFRIGMSRLGHRSNRNHAIGWVSGLRPNGLTNVIGAFQFAFSMRDTRQSVDTVLFLSDGLPTNVNGQEMNTDVVIRRINELNYLGTIQINTFAVGPYGAEFMERLAEENGGTFHQLNQIAPD